jgi:hypothetical protein
MADQGGYKIATYVLPYLEYASVFVQIFYVSALFQIFSGHLPASDRYAGHAYCT